MQQIQNHKSKTNALQIKGVDYGALNPYP